MQSTMYLRDTVRTPRKRKPDAVKKIRVVEKDEQNSHVTDDLLIWGMIYQPLWVQTLVAQRED